MMLSGVDAPCGSGRVASKLASPDRKPDPGTDVKFPARSFGEHSQDNPDMTDFELEGRRLASFLAATYG